jgi:glycosyltransferase involved in cell wall biosynthesis
MAAHTVSIAMTTFNGHRYLGEQLASLAAQSVAPLELVVCDDGSTDSTLEVLHSFASQAPFPVRVIRNEKNLGYRLNFIQAASRCKGSVVAFCDQDDIWNREKVGQLEDHFSRSDDLVVSHDFTIRFEDGRGAIPSYFRFLESGGFPPALCVKGCSLAFRWELIERIGWPESQSNVSHDVWVCLAATLSERRGYLRDPLLTYRIHGANASGVLLGGEKPLARFLRRLPLPPFTSRDERDLMLGFLIPGLLRDDQHAFVRAQIAAENNGLTASQRAYALAGLERNHTIRALITGDRYSRPLRRIQRALCLFLRLAYRNGDGVQGLLLDILGRRV